MALQPIPGFIQPCYTPWVHTTETAGPIGIRVGDISADAVLFPLTLPGLPKELLLPGLIIPGGPARVDKLAG